MKTVIEEIDDAASRWMYRRDEGLSPDDEAKFLQWQAADPRHAEAFTRLSAAWTRVRRARDTGHADHLLERLAGRSARRRTQQVASVSLALCVLAGFFLLRLERPSLPDQNVVHLAETRSLSDGSTIEMKRGSRVEVAYSEGVRQVTLVSGEAHFTVARDVLRPFVVSAGSVDFRAIGTAFAVDLSEQTVELIVTEGRVAIEHPLPAPGAVASGPQSLGTIGAGNRLVMELALHSPAPAPSTVTANEMTERLSWRVPRLEFTDTPLARAVRQMNAHSRIQLVVADESLAALPVSGLFRADKAEAFADVLQSNFGIRAEPRGNVIRLSRAR